MEKSKISKDDINMLYTIKDSGATISTSGDGGKEELTFDMSRICTSHCWEQEDIEKTFKTW